MKRRWYILLLFVGLLLGVAIFLIQNILPIATSYAAKTVCSCLNVSGRELSSIEEDLHPVSYVSIEVGEDQTVITADVLGFAQRSAVYREGLGCTLASECTVSDLQNQAYQNPRSIAGIEPDSVFQFPKAPDSIQLDRNLLKEAIDWAFGEEDPDKVIQTRAVVVIYQGHLVGERYATGINSSTPLLGWSMTKSVTNALTGILVKQGKLGLYEPLQIPEWSAGQDPRKEIQLDHLLRMSSGLRFEEIYGWQSDATNMLFLKKDAAHIAADLPLLSPPDTEWAYSSGTSNIISRLIRDQFDDQNQYLAFPYDALFHKIGMSSAQLEPDASGTYVGSSFMYATARDWAKFGLLYLQDGIWKGERILPEGWVDYSRTRTSTQEHGLYAAHFWTNAVKAVDAPGARYWPDIPQDAYYASGHEGQQVFIVPSRELIVVRLGMTPRPSDWNIGKLVGKVLEALP